MPLRWTVIEDATPLGLRLVLVRAMIRTFPRMLPAIRLAGYWRPLLLTIAGFGVTALVGLVAAATWIYLALGQAPPGVGLDVRNDAADVPLETAIRVVPEGWAPQVESATLVETSLEDGGRSGATREIPLSVEVLRAGRDPGQTELLVRPASGTLRPDAAYRLTVRGSALQAALPYPQPAPFEQEIRFTTPASPRPLPQPEAKTIRWQEPVQIRWSMPIEELRYQVSPPATTRSSIDSADRRTAQVVIENPEEATTYEVTVTDALGANGMLLQRPATYRATTPVRPRLVDAEETIDVEVGRSVQFRWNVPVEKVEYAIGPEVASAMRPVPGDPKATELRLQGLDQGTTYELTISGAQTASGAPLAEPRTITLVTPRKLMVDEIVTAGGARASVGTRPIIVFADPIRDRRVAEGAISVEPPTPGRFEWLDDTQVRFIPNRSLPYDTEVTFRIRPGPDGPRSVSGGYFERAPVLSFTTEVDKIIDVNVTRQVMTLIEQGRAVQTLPVATGVPGADTPLGEFSVQYKMPIARFRGTNPGGRTYDIADVKWVLAFMGDYTIHGAYWRAAFGTPGSNGCVSLTDANAKLVYDWAPEGTLVRIHF